MKFKTKSPIEYAVFHYKGASYDHQFIVYGTHWSLHLLTNWAKRQAGYSTRFTPKSCWATSTLIKTPISTKQARQKVRDIIAAGTNQQIEMWLT